MKKKGLKSRPLARKTAREYTPPKERGIKGPVFRWGFLLFVAVWMFVLGIIVGRYATPVDFDPRLIEKELAELRAAEMQKEKERLKAEAKALYDMDLDFYVALPSPGKAPPFPAVEETPMAPPETKRPLSTKPSAPGRFESRIVPPAAPKPPASVPPAASKPPATEPEEPRSASGRYAIQVASFVEASDADQTVALLKRRGYATAYRTEDHVPGFGLRYRVRIGPFRDTAAAGGMLAELKKMGRFKDAFILKNRHP